MFATGDRVKCPMGAGTIIEANAISNPGRDSYVVRLDSGGNTPTLHVDHYVRQPHRPVRAVIRWYFGKHYMGVLSALVDRCPNCGRTPDEHSQRDCHWRYVDDTFTKAVI